MPDTPVARWFACSTDVGRERSANEDAHAEIKLPDDGLLLIVCDGMGGHDAGEIASAIAVDTIGRVFCASPGDDPRARLYRSFIDASEAITSDAERSGHQGMGTTAVAAFVRGDEAFVAHAGDSRLYQLRNGEVIFRTKDHTRVQRMLDDGALTEEQAKDHPDANVIIRALGHGLADGGQFEADVRANPLKLEPGDALVLCSDGLYDLVEDDEIGGVLAGQTADGGAAALVMLANARGGHDNITVSVLLYGSEHGYEASASAVARTGTGAVRPAPSEPHFYRNFLITVVVGTIVIGSAIYYLQLKVRKAVDDITANALGGQQADLNAMLKSLSKSGMAVPTIPDGGVDVDALLNSFTGETGDGGMDPQELQKVAKEAGIRIDPDGGVNLQDLLGAVAGIGGGARPPPDPPEVAPPKPRVQAAPPRPAPPAKRP